MDVLTKKLVELNQKMYGPRYCDHCKQVQPVRTYKLKGSDKSSFKDGVYTASFVGAYSCAVCLRHIQAIGEGEK